MSLYKKIFGERKMSFSEKLNSNKNKMMKKILIGIGLSIIHTFVLAQLENTPDRYDEDKWHPTQGYFISSTGGWGGNFSDIPSAEWDLVVGSIRNKRLWVGLGFGVNFNGVTLSRFGNVFHHFVPVFTYGRYYLTDKKHRLFAYSRLGYGIPLPVWETEKHKGGLQFQPGIGIHFASRQLTRFLITIGQNFQYTEIDITNFDVQGSPILRGHSQWYSRTILKIGISLDGIGYKN